MKRIYLLLALAVSSGTLAQSQIILTGPQARIIIAKLDSLDYLRAGYAFQDSLLETSNREIYNRSLAVDQRDSIITTQVRVDRSVREKLAQTEAKARFWKYTSGGLAIATITAILIGVFK